VVSIRLSLPDWREALPTPAVMKVSIRATR
jgi:hypothetical protein